MLDLLKPGKPYTLVELGIIAQVARKHSGHSQKRAASELNSVYDVRVSQPHISKAERGAPHFKFVLFKLIEYYSAFRVKEEPTFLVEPKE